MHSFLASSPSLRFPPFAAPARRRGGTVLRGQQGTGWGVFLVGVALIMLLAGAGFLYIHQVTSSAVGGYDVVSLERQVNSLKEREQQLELQAAELQSLKAIEESIRRLNFIPTREVSFTSPLVGGAVTALGSAEEL